MTQKALPEADFGWELNVFCKVNNLPLLPATVFIPDFLDSSSLICFSGISVKSVARELR